MKCIQDEIQTFYKDFNDCNFVRIECIAERITDFVASGSFASLRENVHYYNTPNYALMVKTQDFQNGFTKDLTYTDKESYNFLSNSNLSGGELILSNIGSIGKVFIVPKLDIKMTLASNSIMVDTFFNTIIKWLYYFFRSPIGQKYLNEISSGSTMKKFNKTELRKAIIPIYSFKYIKNSIDIIELLLSLIMDIEHKTVNINTVKVNLKYQILNDIFSNTSSYKSYYEKGYTIENDAEILDNLRKPINATEREQRLSKSKDRYPYYGATGQVGFINEYLIEGNYVLAGEDGAPFLDKYKNKAYIINGKSWVNNHAHILKSNSNNKFLMYYLNWFNHQDYVSGTTRLKLTQGNLRKIPFINISKVEKDIIVEKLDKIFETIDNM